MSELAPVAPAPSAPAAPPPAAPAEGGTPAQNTAEQAPATAPEGEKPDTGQDPEKQSPRRFERRLDRAYRKAAEAQARAEFFEKQLNEFKAKASPSEDPAAPKLEDFKDITDWGKALAKHESDKALRTHQEKQRAETWKQTQDRLAKDWESKADRGADKYEDFHDVVGGDIKPNSPMAMAMMEADNGEEIAYYLGKNEKELQRIAALSPSGQIREIGKLEAKLDAEPPKPRTPSKAPAPITPLKGAAPVATDVPSENDDMRDWMRKRQKQVHGKR